jgi:hypothetical protein
MQLQLRLCMQSPLQLQPFPLALGGLLSAPLV